MFLEEKKIENFFEQDFLLAVYRDEDARSTGFINTRRRAE